MQAVRIHHRRKLVNRNIMIIKIKRSTILVPIDTDFDIDLFWSTGAPVQPIFPAADVHCSGSESTIADCPLSGIDIHDDCYPKSDVGIACPIHCKLTLTVAIEYD